LLDLPKTKHEFFACLDEGIKTFFGLDAGQNVNATVLQSVAQSSEMILNAHGYFNTILRQIVRGTSDLIGQTGAAIGVGQNSTFEPKAQDLRVNVCKEKQLSNMRAKSDGAMEFLKVPTTLTLEESIEYVGDDELVEVTPVSIRLRKVWLRESDEARAKKGFT
jgi:predicted membrane GTPase involved in stress response